MSRRVKKYRLPDLSQELYRRLYSLNFRGASPMRRALRLYRSWSTACVFVIHDLGKVLAWSLVTPGRRKDLIRASFYVRKKYRRQGLGTRLKRAVTSEAKRRRCLWGHWDHSSAAKAFFTDSDCTYSVYRPPNVRPYRNGSEWIWPSPRRRK
jgi:GNAT superfamily N-acetyltransferase